MSCMRELIDWMRGSWLAINESKTEVLCLGIPLPDALSWLWPAELSRSRSQLPKLEILG